MIKILFLTILSLCIATPLMSQSKIRYQGDVQIGYSIGLGPGDYTFDRVTLDVINGIRINEYFSIGIGARFELPLGGMTETEIPMGVVPVYLNNKGYLPINEKMSLVFSLDVGVPFNLNDSWQLTGFMVVPLVGVSFQKRGNQALTLSLGYDYMIWRKDVYKDAIAFKFGYSF